MKNIFIYLMQGQIPAVFSPPPPKKKEWFLLPFNVDFSYLHCSDVFNYFYIEKKLKNH